MFTHKYTFIHVYKIKNSVLRACSVTSRYKIIWNTSLDCALDGTRFRKQKYEFVCLRNLCFWQDDEISFVALEKLRTTGGKKNQTKPLKIAELFEQGL